MAWIFIIFGSIIFGAICTSKMQKKKALLCSVLGPPQVLLVVLLVDAYVLPYSGGGASMWPIAFTIGGFFSAIFGLVGFVVARYPESRE